MALKGLLKKIKQEGRLFRMATLDPTTMDQEKRTVELSFSSEEPYERYFGMETLGHGPGECRLGRLNNGGAGPAREWKRTIRSASAT